MTKKPSRYVQILMGDYNEATMHALDKDGRVWRFVPNSGEEGTVDFWTQLTDQREIPTEGP